MGTDWEHVPGRDSPMWIPLSPAHWESGWASLFGAPSPLVPRTIQCHYTEVLVTNTMSGESSTGKGALSSVFQRWADTQFAHRVTGLPAGIEHQDRVGPLSKW